MHNSCLVIQNLFSFIQTHLYSSRTFLHSSRTDLRKPIFQRNLSLIKTTLLVTCYTLHFKIILTKMNSAFKGLNVQ